MATIESYQESTDSSTTYLDYCEVPYPLFEDPIPLPFYDTPQILPHRSLYYPRIEKKRRILEYCAKY